MAEAEKDLHALQEQIRLLTDAFECLVHALSEGLPEHRFGEPLTEREKNLRHAQSYVEVLRRLQEPGR
jgi:hypothetical protein